MATIGITEAELDASHRYSTPLSLSSTVIDTSADTTLLLVVMEAGIYRRKKEILKMNTRLINNALCFRMSIIYLEI